MYTLKKKTKKMASTILGINSEIFIDSDYDEEIKFLNDNGKCSFVPKKDERVIDRGNPLLTRDEFLTMDKVNRSFDEKINQLNNIKGI